MRPRRMRSTPRSREVCNAVNLPMDAIHAAVTPQVNGELRQPSNARHLIFSIWGQIAELSPVMTLEPGDPFR